MQKYKVKSILNNYLIVEYRTETGSLKELYVFVEANWSKEKIEEEIAKQKLLEDKKDTKIDIAQYFSKGDELEFVPVISDDERLAVMNESFKKEQEELKQKENQEFLNRIIEYRNTPVNYDQVRWYSFPSIEEQLDALYWMRQGVMEPIQEIDAKIAEIKDKYPKNQPTNLTCGDLDEMFSDVRPTDYLDALRAANVEADFI
jgi:hypothetical protein